MPLIVAGIGAAGVAGGGYLASRKKKQREGRYDRARGRNLNIRTQVLEKVIGPATALVGGMALSGLSPPPGVAPPGGAPPPGMPPPGGAPPPGMMGKGIQQALNAGGKKPPGLQINMEDLGKMLFQFFAGAKGMPKLPGIGR